MESGIDSNPNKFNINNGAFYFSRILFLSSLFFLGNIISILGGMKSASLLYHIHLSQDNMVDFFSKPTNNDAIIYIQNLYLILSFGLPALVFMQYHAKQDMYEYMGIEKIKSPAISYILIIASALFMVPIIDTLSNLNHLIPGLETNAERKQNIDTMLKIFLSGESFTDLTLNILSVALLPAICEELFFRASIQNIITEWTKKPYLAVCISALLFSFIHGDLSAFIPRVAAGICLGLVYLYTKNIGISILFHFIYNCFSVVGKWLENRGNISISDLDSWPIIVTIITTILLAASIFYLNKINRNSNVII